MLESLYEFMFITVPWYAWYALFIVCIVIIFWPEGED